MHYFDGAFNPHGAVQGIQRCAESVAASTEKAAADFNGRQTVLSVSPNQATQVADLLKAVRKTVSEIATGPEPAPEPQKSEKTGKGPILLHNTVPAAMLATGQMTSEARFRSLLWCASLA